MATTWTQVSKASGTGWTEIAKPATSSVLTSVGEPIGLLLALTYSETTTIPIDIWSNINKPTGTGWTTIAKAT